MALGESGFSIPRHPRVRGQGCPARAGEVQHLLEGAPCIGKPGAIVKDVISARKREDCSSLRHPTAAGAENQRMHIPSHEFHLASSRLGDIWSPEEIAADDCQKRAFPPRLCLKCSFALQALPCASGSFHCVPVSGMGWQARLVLDAKPAPTFEKLTPGHRETKKPRPILWPKEGCKRKDFFF